MDLEEDKVQADEFKNQGNESFKKKDYSSAVESYTNAISKERLISNSSFDCARKMF